MTEFNYFSFVTDGKYKKILESDYKEIIKCIENECNKSATTLSGSLIEALLTDYLLDKGFIKIKTQNGMKEIKTEQAGLADIIHFCHENKLITRRVYFLLEAIRDFRNFIHPTKAIRMEVEVNKEDAILYKSTLDIILNEISKKRQTELGSTAEQLLHFMLSDDHAIDLFDHMVKNVNNEEERKKYLLFIAPRQLLADHKVVWGYFDTDGPNFSSNEEEDHCNSIITRIDDIETSYHICFNSSTADTKKYAAIKMVDVLRHGDSEQKNIYSRLFKKECIDLITEKDKDFLVDYLLLNSKDLVENKFIELLNISATKISKEKRMKIIDKAIYLLKVKEFKNINESISNFVSEIKEIDVQEYNEIVRMLSSLIKSDSDSAIIDFNYLIADILKRLQVPVPSFVPF